MSNLLIPRTYWKNWIWRLLQMPFSNEQAIFTPSNRLREKFTTTFLWEKFTTKHLCVAGDLRRVGEVLTPWPCFSIAVRREVLEDEALSGALKTALRIVRDTALEFKSNPNNASVLHVAERYRNTEADAAAWLATVEWACEPRVALGTLRTVGRTLVAVGALDQAVLAGVDLERDFVGRGCELVVADDNAAGWAPSAAGAACGFIAERDEMRFWEREMASGVTIWNKICFVVDFRNLLFGCDFDLSFSQGYSLMKIFNYEADFMAKCPT